MRHPFPILLTVTILECVFVPSNGHGQTEVTRPVPDLASPGSTEGAGRARDKPDESPRKLTPTQVEQILAAEIGQWESRGQYRPVDAPPQNVRHKITVRWKEKGKSTECSIQQIGTQIQAVSSREYDPVRGIFLLKYKEGNDPEKIAHERYDPATRTFHGRGVKPPLPANERIETQFQQLGKAKFQWTMEVFRGDQVVFTSEQTQTRIGGPTGDKSHACSILWEFEAGGVVSSNPAIGADGTIFVGAWDKKVDALDRRTGQKIWDFETRSRVDSSPAVGPDGTVYIGQTWWL